MKEWSIKKRVAVLSGCLLANIVLVQAVGLFSSRALETSFKTQVEVEIPMMRAASSVDMSHDALRGSVYRALQFADSGDQKLKQEIRDEAAVFSKALRTQINLLDQIGGENQPLSIDAATKSAKPLIEKYIRESETVIEEALTSRRAEALQNLPKVQASFVELGSELEKLSDLVSKESDQTKAQGFSSINFSHQLGLFVLIVSMLLGLLNAWWAIQSITRRVTAIVTGLNGDASELNQSARDIFDTSESLARSSSKQSSALHETASAIEEMSAMVKKSSDNAKQSRDVGVASEEVATRGKKTVEEMIDAIREINHSNDRIGMQIEESNQKISEIVKVITEIGNKTKVINDIVFQTKLLSFNASVEAARAGEHGKGFAVVAEEVGNLAQMSGNAAKEISDMLNGSIQKVEQIVGETRSKVESLISDGKAKVKTGTTIAEDCGRILEDMVKNVGEVNRRIGEISEASQEQALGISEITKAMNQLTETTNENSATSTQASRASGALKSQSDSLMGAVGSLKALAGMSTVENFQAPRSRTEVAPARSEPSIPQTASGNNRRPPGTPMDWKPMPSPSASMKEPAASTRMTIPVKKVVNDHGLPSEDDPRFQDL